MSELSESSYQFLMNISTGFYLVCYIPELYANYKNKNANFWNVPEKVLLLAGTTLSLAYGILIQDSALIYNYGPLFALDILALAMRVYYATKNRTGSRIRLYDEAEANIVSPSQEGDGTVRQTTGTDKTQV